jgi:chitin-binding protein
MMKSSNFLTILAFGALASVTAYAHGTLVEPVSRVYKCYEQLRDGTKLSASCQAAVNKSGVQMLYDWNGINQLPNGDHKAFVPDGRLCGAGKDLYTGMDLAQDWELTPLVPDANGRVSFVYYASAPHATRYFQFFITKDSYDHKTPLKWSDLEPAPFCEVTNVTLVDQRYKMNCKLPPNKKGRHVIYGIWQRSDSPEAFYSCSDVQIAAPGTPACKKP